MDMSDDDKPAKRFKTVVVSEEKSATPFRYDFGPSVVPAEALTSPLSRKRGSSSAQSTPNKIGKSAAGQTPSQFVSFASVEVPVNLTKSPPRPLFSTKLTSPIASPSTNSRTQCSLAEIQFVFNFATSLLPPIIDIIHSYYRPTESPFNILVVGDANVGKSSFVSHHNKKEPRWDRTPHDGVNVCRTSFTTNFGSATCLLWDVPASRIATTHGGLSAHQPIAVAASATSTNNSLISQVNSIKNTIGAVTSPAYVGDNNGRSRSAPPTSVPAFNPSRVSFSDDAAVHPSHRHAPANPFLQVPVASPYNSPHLLTARPSSPFASPVGDAFTPSSFSPSPFGSTTTSSSAFSSFSFSAFPSFSSPAASSSPSFSMSVSAQSSPASRPPSVSRPGMAPVPVRMSPSSLFSLAPGAPLLPPELCRELSTWRDQFAREKMHPHLDGAVIMFDLTDINTFYSVSDLYNQVVRACGPIPVVLCANKVDAKSQSVYDEVCNSRNPCGLPDDRLHWISTRNGFHMDKPLEALVRLLVGNDLRFVNASAGQPPPEWQQVYPDMSVMIEQLQQASQVQLPDDDEEL